MVDSIRGAYGTFAQTMDVTTVVTTAEQTDDGHCVVEFSSTETALRPFNMEWSKQIQAGFEPGKVQLATYLIHTKPQDKPLEKSLQKHICFLANGDLDFMRKAIKAAIAAAKVGLKDRVGNVANLHECRLRVFLF